MLKDPKDTSGDRIVFKTE